MGALAGRAERRLVAVVIALAVVGAIASACGGGAGSAASAAAGDGVRSTCAGPRTADAEGWVEPMRSPRPQLPVTVTDFTGESVTVEDASRVLALDTYGTLAATVHALGLGDRLVGRDVSTGIPELADLPLVTHDGHELNAEAILALRPTLVLTDYSIGPLEVQLQLKDSGIPVVILDGNRSRDSIGAQIQAVADALGVGAAGTELAERVEADVREAEAEVAAMAPSEQGERVRMVFLYMRGTSGVYYWFGQGSGADDLIDALGGVDVAEEVGLEGSRPLNAEGLVSADPDLFIMMSDGLASVGGVEGLLSVPGVAETPAGSGGCVVDMSDHQILSYGPQFPYTLRALARAVYGPDGVHPSPEPSR